jgi:hypothetical protein
MTAGLNAGVVWANTFNKFDPTLLLVDTRKVESGEKEGSKDWPPTVKLAINEKQFSS